MFKLNNSHPREEVFATHVENGEDKWTRPKRYLWLIKYNEELQTVAIEECGEFHSSKGEHKYPLYKCGYPFFLDGCVCAYCVAENEATAESRVIDMILGSLRVKHRFLEECSAIRYSKADGRENAMVGEYYDEDGRPWVPYATRVALDEKKREEEKRAE